MITTIFKKSKPINFLIVFLFSVIALLGALFKYNNKQLTTGDYSFLLFSFIGIYFSILVLDFIVTKNTLSQKGNLEIVLFSLFVLTIPQVFFNYKYVFSNILLLFALRRLLSLRTQKNTVKKLFDYGFLITLAAIFHFWVITFFPVIFVAMLFHVKNDKKQWIIPFLGLLSVVIIAITYSLIINNNYISALNINTSYSVDLSPYNTLQFMISITMLLSFGLWSSIFYLSNISKKKKTIRPSYKIVFLCTIIASIIVVIANNKDGSEFIFLFAPLTIVISNYIETIKEQWFKELFVFIILILPFILLIMK